MSSLGTIAQDMKTREQIIQIVSNIFSGTDQKNWPLVEASFATNVMLDYTSMTGGEPNMLSPQEITKSWAAVLPGFDKTRHMVHHFEFEQRGPEITVKHDGTANHYLDNKSWTVVGNYEHQLIKENAQWKVSAMTFNLEFLDGDYDLPRLAKEKIENGKQSNDMEKNFNPGKNRISFQSEGNKLVGDLYLPADYDIGKSYPALVIGGSWTTVKEQMAGLYAEKLAQNGFVTLAFDHSNYGESEGDMRFYEDPALKAKDFQNAISYISELPMVIKERTGGMGVCASGGYMADAIAQDGRFKSFAAVVPWFNTDEVVNAFYGGAEGINERIERSREAEASYKATGEMSYQLTISDTDPTAAMYGPFGYYLDPAIGKVENWSADKFAIMNWEQWLTYRPMASAAQIKTPTLIITSKGAATPQAGQEFFDRLQGEKELVWIEGGQLDFYYQPEQVDASIEKLVKHFRRTL